jgi:hypothetical protein
MTCIAFSQSNIKINLTPDTVLVDSLGVAQQFCWRITDQVPSIAKHIVKSKYADSLELQQGNLLSLKDSIIDIQAIVIELQDQRLDNYKDLVIDYNNQQKGFIKKVNKLDRQKKFWKSTTGILFGICMSLVSFELLR